MDLDIVVIVVVSRVTILRAAETRRLKIPSPPADYPAYRRCLWQRTGVVVRLEEVAHLIVHLKFVSVCKQSFPYVSAEVVSPLSHPSLPLLYLSVLRGGGVAPLTVLVDYSILNRI